MSRGFLLALGVLAVVAIAGIAEIYGGGILTGTNAPQTDPTTGVATGIDALMLAIARAEGSPPAWNNPGDLTASFGFSNSGPQNADGVLGFATVEDGWGALRAQLNLAKAGLSRVYSASMSILDMGMKYAGVSQGSTWAANVAAALGVDTSTPIGSFLNA